MRNVAKNSVSLPKLATELNNLFTQMETCYVSVCTKMGEAREEFEDDEDFWDWVEDYTPFKRAMSLEYLQVHKNVLSGRGQSSIPNAIPFKVLRVLSKTNIPKTVQNKVLRDFEKHQLNPEKFEKPKLEDIKRVVNESLGKTPVKKVPAIVRKESFSSRLDYADKFDVSALWLFDLPQDYCPETASIVVKYWKQKYHPDKGGNKYHFALLSEKANELEVQ